ncbi:hypothetical protein [Croceicoccus hydrothermalis]|uniref:hypothetical protein n=1 Tax=Croceicoccus hydrothermalis TaxID=2867964 RepID=UPI003B830AA7
MFLYREPRETIASLIEGWHVGERTGQFVTFRNLPRWDRDVWCLALPSGWRAMKGRSLAEIAAFQWHGCNTAILKELTNMASERLAGLSYGALISHPADALAPVARLMQISPDAFEWTAATLPLSASTISPPRAEKWRLREPEIAPSIEDVEPLYRQMRKWSAHY